MQIKINESIEAGHSGFALFHLGFRPFFLGASFFAIASIIVWMLVYFAKISVTVTNISISQWHAHEMLYGYTMAVIAGFLLTAVKNWTGHPTISGKPLILLFSLWVAARVLFLLGTNYLIAAAACDLFFGLLLMISIIIPIMRAKQWKQIAVVSKVLLLWIGNVIFFLGCFGTLTSGMHYAITGAVLLIVSLVLMVGRRIIPFFIERGVPEAVKLNQYKWLDISIMVVFLALFMSVIFLQVAKITAILALTIFLLNSYRLMNWHVKSMWKIPLLWSLYLSAWLVNIGFALYALEAYSATPSMLTLHVFTIGGIGLMTLSMMSRVSLGHTGRNIKKPSRWINLAFFSLTLSVLFRVFLPMIKIEFYTTWILISAIFWILSFLIFLVVYTPILVKPRVDGVYG